MIEPTTAVETDYAPGWKPQGPGDTVGGKVIDITARESNFGKGPYPIVTLEDEGGTQVAVHAFHTVLRGELAKRRPKIGDELEITYLGKKGEGGSYGNGYDMYRVKGGGVNGGFDWDSELSREDQGSVSVPAAPVVPVAPAVSTVEQFGEAPPF